MMQTCEVSGVQFEISPADLAFYEAVSPVIGGQKLLIPPPRLCPNERQRRRLAFRNERFLYKRQCAISGEPIVSAYSPDIDLKVCAKDAWRELDNCDFGRDFDFSRPFFEQYEELMRDVYKCAVIQDGEMENSAYTHFTGWLKNCYMVFDTGKCEDCIHSNLTVYSKDCCDALYLYQCELCYDSVKLENCYETFFSSNSANCSSSAYLDDCIGCSNCLCCTNLRNVDYYAFNQPVGKERFREIWAEYMNGSHSGQLALQEKFAELLLASPHRAVRCVNCEDVTGDELTRCKSVYDSYNCTECRDCRYCYDLPAKTSDCYDVATFGEGMQYCYELSACGGTFGQSEVSNCFFSNYIFYGGFNILYSINCHENCQNLFGCSDLRRKKHCVLNKQYSEAEYVELVQKIVSHMKETGEWGEFFPIALSPFAYNQSLADEFFPLERDGAKRLGSWWSDYESPVPDIKQVVEADQLADIAAAADYGTTTAIRCSVTGKLFKMTPWEIDFLTKYNLPLPRVHPEQRHRNRRAKLNPRQLFSRKCAETGEEILSSYSPDSPYRIVSEEAFRKIVS